MDIFTHRSNEQRQQICTKYKGQYKKDMLKELNPYLDEEINDNDVLKVSSNIAPQPLGDSDCYIYLPKGKELASIT